MFASLPTQHTSPLLSSDNIIEYLVESTSEHKLYTKGKIPIELIGKRIHITKSNNKSYNTIIFSYKEDGTDITFPARFVKKTRTSEFITLQITTYTEEYIEFKTVALPQFNPDNYVIPISTVHTSIPVVPPRKRVKCFINL